MSIAVMTAIWRIDLPPKEKLVALALADVANEMGGSIFPSIATIAQKTSIPERTVMRVMACLRERELLIEVEAARPGVPTKYRMNLAGIGVLSPAPRPGPRSCPPAIRLQVIEAFNQECQYCHTGGDEKNGPDGRPWHADRLIPGSRGGTYAPENVTLSCSACNSRKKNHEVTALPDSLGARLAPTWCQNDPADGAKTDTALVPPVAPDPLSDPSEDPSVGALSARAREDELTPEQRDILHHLHAEVRDHLMGGATAPEGGWCVDLARRGMTLGDCDAAVQAAIEHNVKSLAYVRGVLTRRIEDREAGLDPDAPKSKKTRSWKVMRGEVKADHGTYERVVRRS